MEPGANFFVWQEVARVPAEDIQDRTEGGLPAGPGEIGVTRLFTKWGAHTTDLSRSYYGSSTVSETPYTRPVF
jgi:hypothetical protein